MPAAAPGLVDPLPDPAQQVPGSVPEEMAYRRLAAELGIAYADLDELVPDPRSAERLPGIDPRSLHCMGILHSRSGVAMAIAPRGTALARLSAALARLPGMRRRLCMTAPANLRAVRDCQNAVDALHAIDPALSARGKPGWGQSLAGFLLLILGLAAAVLAPAQSAIAALPLTGLVFLSAAAVRLAAAARPADPPPERPPERPPEHPPERSPMERRDARAARASHPPFVSVLVPVYREVAVLPELIAALQCLEFDQGRLEILLVVEADDWEMLDALDRLQPGRPFRRCVVPLLGPRTKPKALSFALAQARGDIVTVYDAEDRPEPDQLQRAVAAFERGGADLGCVQASLAVDHADEGFFAAQFALEYALQFDVLLPWVASRGLPVRLGGTSNHFRRKALVAAGGWDPCNVTEDLDLGIRLLRAGWRTGRVASTTWEEAPVGLAVWCNQRIRWHKGWLQSACVHFRSPWRLLRELGARNALAVTAMFVSILLSLIAYPAFLLMLVASLSDPAWRPDYTLAVSSLTAWAGLVCFLAGHGSILLALREAARRRKLRFGPREIAGLPVYWLLMSAMLAVASAELFVRPLHWRKTEHGRARTRPAAGETNGSNGARELERVKGIEPSS